LQLICYRRLSDCLGCGLDPNWLACHWSLAAVYTAAQSVRKTNMSSIEDLNAQSLKGHQGLKRILRALGYSIAGIRAAVAGEAAFRQLLLLNAVLIPLAFTFEVSRIERVLLVIVPLLTLVIELVNSAIEATIDRISYELHPLSKNAKDMGSAAQLLSLVIVAVTWVMILY
jgi:diacylglycerol kinase (ATP)